MNRSLRSRGRSLLLHRRSRNSWSRWSSDDLESCLRSVSIEIKFSFLIGNTDTPSTLSLGKESLDPILKVLFSQVLCGDDESADLSELIRSHLVKRTPNRVVGDDSLECLENV